MILPELGPDARFSLSTTKPFDEYAEAEQALGIATVPVLLGPVSLLLLSKPADGVDEDFDPLTLLEPLLGVYGEAIERLAGYGADWVQLDEPSFVTSRTEAELEALRHAYVALCGVHERPRLHLKTYFDHAGDAYPLLRELPIEGVGLDFVRGPQNLELIREHGPLTGKTLFAGVVDGRNVWINDLGSTLQGLGELQQAADELVVSTSCSLLHTPIDLDAEPDLDGELRSWMSFAKQKVGEVATLATGVGEGEAAISAALEANRKALDDRRSSTRTQHPEVRERMASDRA